MELEFKYAASAAQLSRIVADCGGDWRETGMETVYYDTPDRALSRRRWTLRLRREGGVPVLCCKTPGPVVRGVEARGEWEWRGEALGEGLARLVAQGAPAALRDLDPAALTPLCGARFTRRARLVSTGGATLELAADRGILTGGGWTQPLCELEAEHKSGDPAATADYAAALARRYGLRPESQSKFRRALSLCDRQWRCAAALPADAAAVCSLIRRAVEAAFPRYYPQAAADDCQALFCPEAVAADIARAELTLLYLDSALAAVAGRRGPRVTRLYVDPDRAGLGCGSALMDRLEREIARESDTAKLDAALPAVSFCQRRGYRTVAHRAVAAGGAVLVSAEMEKRLSQKQEESHEMF